MAPPAATVSEAEHRVRVDHLDPLNQRRNAFVAAATSRAYLDEMGGDIFLVLLAYNIGPRSGGLRAIMTQYGARDFVTIQPYLQISSIFPATTRLAPPLRHTGCGGAGVACPATRTVAMHSASRASGFPV